MSVGSSGKMVTVLVIVLCVSQVCIAKAGEKVRVAIMEFATKGGVTQQQMDALSDLLADTVRSMGSFRVIGANDIRSVLKVEEKKAMFVGCTDVNCMAEIGGALGVRWMVVGNISKFGNAFLLNIKLIDSELVKVIASESEKISGGQEELIDMVPVTARRLFKKSRAVLLPRSVSGAMDKSQLADHQAPAGAVSAKQDKPMSAMSTWGHMTFWSGLGLAAFGGVGLVLGKNEATKYADGEMDAWDSSRTWTGTGLACLGAGAALMIGGVVLWLLDTGDEDSSSSVSAMPVSGVGAAVVFSGVF